MWVAVARVRQIGGFVLFVRADQARGLARMHVEVKIVYHDPAAVSLAQAGPLADLAARCDWFDQARSLTSSPSW